MLSVPISGVNIQRRRNRWMDRDIFTTFTEEAECAKQRFVEAAIVESVDDAISVLAGFAIAYDCRAHPNSYGRVNLCR